MPAMMRALTRSSTQRILIEACLRDLVAFYWHGPSLLLIRRGGLESILSELAERRLSILALNAFDFDGTFARPRDDLRYDADHHPGMRGPEHAIRLWPEDVWVQVIIAEST